MATTAARGASPAVSVSHPEGPPPREPSGETSLSRRVAALAAGRKGKDGLHLLIDGHSAFAARAALARAAERRLDVQYYIWAGDLSGTLLLEELRRAADRGVRVRLLLDDVGTVGLDRPLAALNRHNKVEVRLFNPDPLRHPRWLGFLLHPRRLNRRMHNKSFTADRAATVVGGRNVADAYFAAADDGLFLDLDVLAIGAVARDIADRFELYWSSAASVPAELILPPVGPDGMTEIAGAAQAAALPPAARAYVDAVEATQVASGMRDGTLPMEWAPTLLVADTPQKALGRTRRRELLFYRLLGTLGRPAKELTLISGYFVPALAGTRSLCALARSGVCVSVVTNALEATDVAIVHAGYAPRRPALLRAGVRLFEIRGPRPRPRPGPGAVEGSGGGSSGPARSFRPSASKLHAKTFLVDKRWMFVGSFNLDPRSMRLNTEMGTLIDSPTLAAWMDARLRQRLPAHAWAVRLGPEGQLVWSGVTDGRAVRSTVEPGTSASRRAAIGLLSTMPIEWLL